MAEWQWEWRDGQPPIVRPVKDIVSELMRHKSISDDLTIGLLVWNHFNDIGKPHISINLAAATIYVETEGAVTEETLRKLLSGFTILPYPKTLQAVADFLGISIAIVRHVAAHPLIRRPMC